MEENYIIIIYEKEIKLNQILKEQVSRLKSYKIYDVTDQKKLIELFESKIILFELHFNDYVLKHNILR